MAFEELKEKDIREKVRNGYIRVIVMFELVGKPKEHIEKTMRQFMANIKADERLIIFREEYGDTKEHEDGMFSTFVESEMLVESLEVLTWLAINFSPASIEVMEPSTIPVQASEITGWYNDLLSKVHEVSTVLRTERGVNQGLVTSLNALIKNAILLSARHEPKSIDEIATDLGIVSKQLDPFIKHLVEKKKLVEDDGKYKTA